MPHPTSPFAHLGGTGAMIWLAVKNLLLNIVTLSLWRFWGKARVRRALWNGTTAWGDAAEYTGTGGELFLGFIVVLVSVFMPLMVAFGALQALVESGALWAAPGIGLLQLFVIFLAGAGLYRARRYQMTRTLWRGIRGGQSGTAWRYGLMLLGVGAATILTAGWAWPWAEMTLARYRLNNTTFGSGTFTCDAAARPLYRRFAVLWLFGAVFAAALPFGVTMLAFANDHTTAAETALSVAVFYGLLIVWGCITVVLPYAWYRAGFYRELAAHTRFAEAGFALEATTGSLIRLSVGNALISLLSLGTLRPVAALRTFRYACSHLSVSGEPDWHRICQSAQPTGRLGEGLAAVFDGAGEF